MIRTCVLLSHGRLVGATGSSAYRGNLKVLNQIRQGMVTRSQAEETHKVSVIRSSPTLVNSACDLLRPQDTLLDDTTLCFEIDIEKAVAFVVSIRPRELILERPNETTSHVYAVFTSFQESIQMLIDKVDPIIVVDKVAGCVQRVFASKTVFRDVNCRMGEIVRIGPCGQGFIATLQHATDCCISSASTNIYCWAD